ncbi:MAG: hypothetical protein HYT83_02910 [Candidatus Levybacteria bacterium]|nr:hypothetical protein [Candidatus Levybacteria bacterium]
MRDRKKSIGLAFPDYIGFEQHTRRRYSDNQNNEKQMRSVLLLICLIVGIGILFLRLIFLQLFQGSYYKNLSDTNRIRTSVVHAPRGIIFNRNGVPLVFNVPGFRTVVNGKTVLLGRETAISLIANGKKDIEVDSLRQYPFKEVFSHVLGYIGQISKEELSLTPFSSYESGELVGKMGIEKEYEKILKGTDGKKLAEVDAMGKEIRTLGQTDPIPGENITLTLDSKLQQAAFLAMEKVKKGVVIVSTPQGEILVLLSKPSFDPNLFTLGENYKTDQESSYKNISEALLDSENQPFLNRAISGTYPPGSTFKLITAATGLEDKVIDQNYEVTDNGVLQIGAFSFANWYFTQYGKTEGQVNVVKAIKRSNDIFFYKLAEEVGVERLSQKAKAFGLGERLGIDLQGEEKGIVPSDEWKKKAMGEPWYLGDTYHYGIGQGYLLTTPLQVNAWTQVIANGGMLYQQHLLASSKLKIQSSKLISDKTRELIRQGMIEACLTGGVAWPLFEFKVKNSKFKVDGNNFLEAPQATTSANFSDYRKVSIACKTGTAQHGGEQTLPHAWITLFAPAYDPQIVVTVLVESSGEGSNVAAPIAKKVLEEWFGRQ